MKNNKKFVLAAGAAALGLVAATGVTSGFAWFAVNDAATITSMNVTAKTDSPYLLVREGGEFADADTFRGTTAPNIAKEDITFTDANVELKPAAYGFNAAALEDLSYSKLATKSNWYTAAGTSWQNGARSGDKTALTNDNFTAYVMQKTITVGLLKGSPAIDGLKLNSVTITLADEDNGVAGLSVYVASHTTGSTAPKSFGASTDAPAFNITPVSSESFDDDDLAILDIYYFIDGEVSTVTLEKAALLAGSIAFDIGVANA